MLSDRVLPSFAYPVPPKVLPNSEQSVRAFGSSFLPFLMVGFLSFGFCPTTYLPDRVEAINLKLHGALLIASEAAGR